MVQQQSAAPRGNAFKVFAPYFKARWQNMQNIVTDNVFFSQMPWQWQAYQKAYVQQWAEWSRGFVLRLHRRDMFSIGLGYTICEILTKECMKGGFRFDGKDPAAVKFANDWKTAVDLEEGAAKGFMNANRVGNNILRLNPVIGGGQKESYPTEHGVDSCFFEIDRKGEIVRAIFLDYLAADTIGGQDTSFYAVETRQVYKGVGYRKVEVFRNGGTVTAPALQKDGLNSVKFEQFGENLKSRWLDLYGEEMPGEWYVLPYRRGSIGCYNWKNKATSVAISNMPGMSDSSIHTALDILYSLDYNWSNAQLDQYWSRTRVIVPKQFRRGDATKTYVHNGKTYTEALNLIEEAPLEDDVYLETPQGSVLSDKPSEPKFIQPDMRVIDHKASRDADLELLASKVGLSSTTLANHLSYNTSKTATEVNAETDTTDITVGNKRGYAANAIEEMMRDVLYFYGVGGEVTVAWNQNGNEKKVRETVLQEVGMHLMPRREALKKLHPELSEAEVSQWLKEVDAEQGEADIFGEKSILE